MYKPISLDSVLNTLKRCSLRGFDTFQITHFKSVRCVSEIFGVLEKNNFRKQLFEISLSVKDLVFSKSRKSTYFLFNNIFKLRNILCK